MNELGILKRISILFVFCAVMAIGTPAQKLTTLHRFDNADGASPTAGLIQGSNGNLYGTTRAGGTYGYGTVFSITADGELTTLHNFCQQISVRNCTDGSSPSAGLVEGTNGDFYGTTYYGAGNGGYGTVFSITADGKLTTLHSFDGTDGGNPYAGLVQGSDGKFYGTTVYGGPNDCGGRRCGTVFSISPTPPYTLTTLHSFDGTDGGNPYAGLVQGSDGKFYGTTRIGGADGGYGTVFSVTAGGELKTLHSFAGFPTDGSGPLAGLVQGTDGKLYGTTSGGGPNACVGNSCGTVFSITPSGKLTTLYNFCSETNCADGESPVAALVKGTDGKFYGTTYAGGSNSNYYCMDGCGTAFSITSSGTLKPLYIFCSNGFPCRDGFEPLAGLIRGTNGKFYGTASIGGTSCNCGTVFSLSGGLGPFVDTEPATGTVQVVTSGGTLSSNVPFQVLP